MTSPGRLDSPSQVVEDGLQASSTTSCIVIVEESFQSEVRFANNTSTTNGQRRDRSITAIAFEERTDGMAVGVSAQSGSVDIRELVRAAERECRDAPVAEDAAPLVSRRTADSFVLAPEPTLIGVLDPVVGSLPEAFARAESEKMVLAGFARHSMTTTYLGSSTGLRERNVQPDGTFELVARSNDGERSAWVGMGTNDFADVFLDKGFDRLRQRLTWAKKRIDVAPGRHEVILPPDAVADLMIPLEEAFSGREAEEGQSVFSSPAGTRLGERLGSLPFVLATDPNEPGISCAPFFVTRASGTDSSVFDNGYPIDRVEWIAAGQLRALRYHRAGASRSNVAFHPPADNLVLSVPGASGATEDLVRNCRRGLLLTCLWYIREVDLSTLLLTGLTRDGVYVIEDGEVVGAANNFRFNESPVDLLAQAIEAGKTERALSREWNEWMSLTAMPALRVSDFNMSSVSPAN